MVGEYIYVDDFELVWDFEKNVFYYFDFIGDKLIIGKFCVFVNKVIFIMNGVNYLLNGVSIYLFYIFGNGWEMVVF